MAADSALGQRPAQQAGQGYQDPAGPGGSSEGPAAPYTAPGGETSVPPSRQPLGRGLVQPPCRVR
eukprot:1922540-Pyramimonas_sp.AAC.1